jgi:hypothetical protein
MAYRIAGTYVAACNCELLCACPVDGPPTGEGGECRGVAVFSIREGNLDGTDLSGVNVALWNYFPSNISSGNWTVGIVVDESASDEQARAAERIISGQEGGAFAEFAPLMGQYQGMERGRVSLSDSSISVGGRGDARFEALTGPDGSETTVSNAMFGFAPVFKVGKTSGRIRADREVDAKYGESADFEYSSEMGAEEVRPRG